MEAFLRNERVRLRLAVEANVMTDVNATSGIQTQAYATSVLTTLRKGINKLEVAGFTPAAFVLAPADWERRTGVVQRVRGRTFIVAVRPRQPAPIRYSCDHQQRARAGVGHVLAMDAVALDTDQRGVDVQWSENATADSFSKNLVFARCEARYAVSV